MSHLGIEIKHFRWHSAILIDLSKPSLSLELRLSLPSGDFLSVCPSLWDTASSNLLLSSLETSWIWSTFQSFTKHAPHELFQAMFTSLDPKSRRWTRHTWPQKVEKALPGSQPSECNFSSKKLSPGFNPLASDVATQHNILNHETAFAFWLKTSK